MIDFPRLQPPGNYLAVDGAEMNIETTKSPGRESLADFVRRIRTVVLNFSLADVERESGRHGERIVASYVWRIENDLNTNPSPRKLKALARGLRVDEEELFSIVRGKSLSDPNAIEHSLLTKFRELPGDRQKDVLRILDSLHREHGAKPATEITKKRPKKRVA